MAVFPAASRKHVPVAFQKLMYDSESEIVDFYPEDFQIDLNGKKQVRFSIKISFSFININFNFQSWMGVALLPFGKFVI